MDKAAAMQARGPKFGSPEPMFHDVTGIFSPRESMRGRGRRTPRSLPASICSRRWGPNTQGCALSSTYTWWYVHTYTCTCENINTHIILSAYHLNDQWAPNFLIMTELGWEEKVGEARILAVPCLILSGKTHDLVSCHLRPNITITPLLYEYHTHLADGNTEHLWNWSDSSKFKELVTESKNQIKSSTIKSRLFSPTWAPEKHSSKQ